MVTKDDITFLDLGPGKRRTVCLQGRQVGYFYPDSGHLHFAPEHQPDDVAEQIKQIVEEVNNCQVTRVLIPPEEPPEWSGLGLGPEYDFDDDETDVD